MNSFNANIDPDFNFLEPRLRSRYFSPHSFAETIKSKINQNHRNCISILHSNIRSLKRNFEQFHQHVLSELKVSFSVIGLTEIRIRDGACNENLPSLPNYYFEYVTTPLPQAVWECLLAVNCNIMFSNVLQTLPTKLFVSRL